MINLDQYPNVGTNWIAIFYKKIGFVHFDSFGVEYIPEKIKDFIEKFPGNKSINANIFRIQEYNSIMSGYFCIAFIDFMLAVKKLTDYSNLFSPYDFKKNDGIIFSYFKNE